MADSPEPWATWFDQHAAVLVLLARQWLTRRADAEDVVQEAFVRFWQARQRVEDPTAYLYSCVKHCAFDRQRGHARRTRREQATARPEAEPMFLATAEQEERRLAIEAALREIPTNQAEVLIMKIWGGLSFPQIAAALGVSINTANSRYRYAVNKLREILAEESLL